MSLHGKFFPLGGSERFKHPTNTKAVYTGEKRPPRKGEWYLSGAPVIAYHTNADLLTPFHIARLVETETITIIRERVK